MPCAVLPEKASKPFFRKTFLPLQDAICPACGSPRLYNQPYCLLCMQTDQQLWPALLAQASTLELETGAFPLVDEGNLIL